MPLSPQVQSHINWHGVEAESLGRLGIEARYCGETISLVQSWDAIQRDVDRIYTAARFCMNCSALRLVDSTFGVCRECIQVPFFQLEPHTREFVISTFAGMLNEPREAARTRINYDQGLTAVANEVNRIQTREARVQQPPITTSPDVPPPVEVEHEVELETATLRRDTILPFTGRLRVFTGRGEYTVPGMVVDSIRSEVDGKVRLVFEFTEDDLYSSQLRMRERDRAQRDVRRT